MTIGLAMMPHKPHPARRAARYREAGIKRGGGGGGGCCQAGQDAHPARRHQGPGPPAPPPVRRPPRRRPSPAACCGKAARGGPQPGQATCSRLCGAASDRLRSSAGHRCRSGCRVLLPFSVVEFAAGRSGGPSGRPRHAVRRRRYGRRLGADASGLESLVAGRASRQLCVCVCVCVCVRAAGGHVGQQEGPRGAPSPPPPTPHPPQPVRGPRPGCPPARPP